MHVKVAERSDYTLMSEECLPSSDTMSDEENHMDSPCAFSKPGALLLRWRRKEFIKTVVHGAGFARAALQLLVTQATLDCLFRQALPAAPVPRYDVMHGIRRRMNVAPLDTHTKPRRQSLNSFVNAHVSLRDLVHPGQEQRGPNSPQMRSRERLVGNEGGPCFARSDIDVLSNSSSPSSPHRIVLENES